MDQRLRLLRLQHAALVGGDHEAAVLVAQAVDLRNGANLLPHRLRDAVEGCGGGEDLRLRLDNHARLLRRVGEAVRAAAEVGGDLRLGHAVGLDERHSDGDGLLLAPQVLAQRLLLEALPHGAHLPNVADDALPRVVHGRRAPGGGAESSTARLLHLGQGLEHQVLFEHLPIGQACAALVLRQADAVDQKARFPAAAEELSFLQLVPIARPDDLQKYLAYYLELDGIHDVLRQHLPDRRQLAAKLERGQLRAPAPEKQPLFIESVPQLIDVRLFRVVAPQLLDCPMQRSARAQLALLRARTCKTQLPQTFPWTPAPWANMPRGAPFLGRLHHAEAEVVVDLLV
mmetsp:Transcript_76334/g.221622  ORF Transcript_76334/g.221622 Transcript_76334/m.221622 type:complete len:343 (-) Transcript_76334:1516-2544(-)